MGDDNISTAGWSLLWALAVTIGSCMATWVGLVFSPSTWWSEGPFIDTNCFAADFDHGAWLLALVGGPLTACALYAGMCSRWIEARVGGRQEVRFERRLRIGVAVKVVLVSVVVTRAMNDATVRLNLDPEYAACASSLMPSVVAWALVTSGFVWMFMCGRNVVRVTCDVTEV